MCVEICRHGSEVKLPNTVSTSLDARGGTSGGSADAATRVGSFYQMQTTTDRISSNTRVSQSTASLPSFGPGGSVHAKPPLDGGSSGGSKSGIQQPQEEDDEKQLQQDFSKFPQPSPHSLSSVSTSYPSYATQPSAPQAAGDGTMFASVP